MLKKVLTKAPASEVTFTNDEAFAFDCKLDDNNDTISRKTDITVRDSVYTGTTINIKSVKLDATGLKLVGLIFTDGTNDKNFSGAFDNSPLITMKNGTSFHAGNKCDATWNMYNDDWESKWYIMSYITPSDVQSITWHGVTIYEAE